MTRDHAEAGDAWNDLTMAGTELDLAPTTRDLREQAAAAATPGR